MASGVRSRWISVVAVGSMLLAMFATAAVAGSSGTDRTEVPQESTTVGYAIVTFGDPPAAQYDGDIPDYRRTRPEPGQKLNANASHVRAYRSYLGGVHGDYTRWLERNAPQARVVRDYTLTANAVAIDLNGAKPATLRRGPGVANVTLSQTYRPTMNASVDLIGASDVWGNLGGQDGAGEGIKVGVIDTGIDTSHPFFGCKGNIPAKVYASGVFGVGQNIVFDHGTHVAGTIAGCVIEGGTEAAPEWLTEGTISGVAPGAELHDYNVFPGFGGGFVAFGGSAFSHDIAAAVEDAVADGMDVINLSLGGSARGPNDFLDGALNGAVDAGVVAAVSAGNSGPNEETVGSPGTAEKVITVGATTNSHVIGVGIFTDPSVVEPPVIGAVGSFDTFTDPAFDDPGAELADWGGIACSASEEPAEEVADKVALINRGACTFTTKVRNAETAGAAGVLIVNNEDGPPVGPAHDDTDPFPEIPALGISQSDGGELRDLMADGAVTMTTNGEVGEFDAEADLIAGFSSRGPTQFTYRLKPEVVAPGVNIVSSVFDDGWEAFQGTSMAAPHVAGAAALLLDANPSLSPAEVKSALVNHADLSVLEDDLGVMDRGAGRLFLPTSMAATVYADPAAVSFGRIKGNTNKAVDPITIELTGSTDGCTADADGPATAAADGDTVTVTLPPARQLPTGDHEGFVTISCDGATDLHVPWFVRVERQR